MTPALLEYLRQNKLTPLGVWGLITQSYLVSNIMLLFATRLVHCETTCKDLNQVNLS